MNMKCVVAGFLLRYSRRHARLPFWVLRPVRPRSSSLSFICQWAHEVSNERRAQVVVPAGIEPARRHYFQAHRRGTRTPSLTERNGTSRQRLWPGQTRYVDAVNSGALAYLSRPTRPAHLLALGICCARFDPVLHRLHPCDLSAGDVFRLASRDVKVLKLKSNTGNGINSLCAT